MTAPTVTRHDRPGDPEPPADTPPDALRDDVEDCMAIAPGRTGWPCMAAKGHEGPHACYGFETGLVATWPQESAS